MQNLLDIDLFYAYLDLEINSDNNIYRIGLVSLNLTKDFYQENLNQAYEEMRKLKSSNLAVCGHNFRRFDYPYRIEQEPQLSSWHIIDTLELSILAFPLQHSHKLNKDYKQSEYSSNNPLEGAQATRLLLGQQLEALFKKPDKVQQVYIWLLIPILYEDAPIVQEIKNEPPKAPSTPRNKKLRDLAQLHKEIVLNIIDFSCLT